MEVKGPHPIQLCDWQVRPQEFLLASSPVCLPPAAATLGGNPQQQQRRPHTPVSHTPTPRPLTPDRHQHCTDLSLSCLVPVLSQPCPAVCPVSPVPESVADSERADASLFRRHLDTDDDDDFDNQRPRPPIIDQQQRAATNHPDRRRHR
ncbi:hypothetical protein CSAL01_06971 [Colletotrichum salicis]|uniref:Uncharacterized protein n=1 Tax=Colletotrichum salicis TaxID=1209931 RepID=A0A135VAN1_9PEZI|nr:hypothetical protein CSAL01_06971 [Colletotrichum salicis]